MEPNGVPNRQSVPMKVLNDAAAMFSRYGNTWVITGGVFAKRSPVKKVLDLFHIFHIQLALKCIVVEIHRGNCSNSVRLFCALYVSRHIPMICDIHSIVALWFSNMFICRAGEHAEALKLVKEALSKLEASNQKDCPFPKYTLKYNLGRISEASGSVKEAEKIYKVPRAAGKQSVGSSLFEPSETTRRICGLFHGEFDVKN